MKRAIADPSKWTVLQGRDERKLELPDVKDTPRMMVEDEIFGRLYEGELDLLPAEKVDPQIGPWALSFHGQAEQLPRYQRLCDEVRGDAFAAACATEEIAKCVAIPDPEKQEPGEDENGNPVPPPPVPPMDPAALRRSLTSGVMQATAAVQEARDVQDGLQGCSWGTESAQGTGQMNGAQVRGLMQKVRETPALLKIAELAGRFRRIAAHKRRSRVRHGQDELQDIEQGGELSRLIPAELVKLTSPTIKLALMRDVLERKALQYRIEGKEAKGKGPLVVCIDKSGSMGGDPDTWATAIALALLQRAQIEKRVFGLICFDSSIKYQATVKPAEALPVDALLVPANGGTDITRAYAAALEVIQKNPGAMAKADVVIITDGDSDASKVAPLREQAKAAGVTCIGFGIGVPGECLRPWADEVFDVRDLGKMDDSAAEALFARE